MQRITTLSSVCFTNRHGSALALLKLTLSCSSCMKYLNHGRAACTVPQSMFELQAVVCRIYIFKVLEAFWDLRVEVYIHLTIQESSFDINDVGNPIWVIVRNPRIQGIPSSCSYQEDKRVLLKVYAYDPNEDGPNNLFERCKLRDKSCDCLLLLLLPCVCVSPAHFSCLLR